MMSEGTTETTDEGITQVLALSFSWQFDTYGISMLNRSFVENLRDIDPKNIFIKIVWPVIAEDGTIPDIDLKDAMKFGVELKGSQEPWGSKAEPETRWLDQSTGTFYRHLITENKYDFIIGHIPYLANGCLNLRDMTREIHKGHSPKVILVSHNVPLNNEGEVDEDLLVHWFRESDLILSVGDCMRLKVDSVAKTWNLSVKNHLYLPSLPLDQFGDIYQKRTELKGDKDILMMITEDSDVETVVVSSVQASRYIALDDGTNLNRHLKFHVNITTNTESEKGHLKKCVEDINDKLGLQGNIPAITFPVAKETDKVQSLLSTSALFVLPQNPQSYRYGVVVHYAIAANVPILVSANSGVASTLQKKGLTEPIVWDNKGSSKSTEEWKPRIIQKITDPQKAFLMALETRKAFEECEDTTDAHVNFTKYIAGSHCAEINIEIDADALPPDRIKDARRLGIQTNRLPRPIPAETFIRARFKKLIGQEKDDRNKVLTDDQCMKWTRMISCLEDMDRKLLSVDPKLPSVDRDKLTLILYCPSQHSAQQLQEPSWISTWEQEFTTMAHALGIKIHSVNTVCELPPAHRPESMTLKDDASEGYASMTTTSSDLLAEIRDNIDEIIPSSLKVQDWLSQNAELQDLEFHKNPSFHLEQTRIAHHIKEDKFGDNLLNTITVTDSGIVGIACRVSDPTLSVMFPQEDRCPQVLTSAKGYWSVVALKINGIEYLAASDRNINGIRLWDLRQNTSPVVYKTQPVQFPVKEMNLCMIAEGMVGYGEVDPAGDGLQRIYVLNTTGANEWDLGSVVLVHGIRYVIDMSYMKTRDGTPCLLLCCPRDASVKAIELVGGKVKWEIGKEHLGKDFCPWSICTDGANKAYVVDLRQQKLHVLSDDGLVLTSFSLRHYGIWFPSCVRLMNGRIYVGHLDVSKKHYQISRLREMPLPVGTSDS